jgi:hypothetical protein
MMLVKEMGDVQESVDVLDRKKRYMKVVGDAK